jgi:diketogulonate reductase-like aldo/keto reductase
MNLKGILEEMGKMQEQSKVKQLGVSNFSSDLVEEALSTKRVVNNQVEFNPSHLQHDNLKTVKENNMFLTAYTPLDKGKVFKNPIISEIAEKYGKNEAQVTLRWLLQHKSVAVIPKAATREHRESNMDIFDFDLSREEMNKIASN